MVLMFDLSTVIKLGIRHPREKKRKRGSMRSPGRNLAWYHFLPSSSHVFWVISDDVGAARRRKLWCRIWISLALRRCSFIPAMEPVQQSILYARSVISRSGATLRCHHGTWFKKDMDPKGDFFWKMIRPKSLIGLQGRAFTLGFATLSSTSFFPNKKRDWS